jgi:hypothetical protein
MLDAKTLITQGRKAAFVKGEAKTKKEKNKIDV